MIRYILTKNNIEMFDLYDKLLKIKHIDFKNKNDEESKQNEESKQDEECEVLNNDLKNTFVKNNMYDINDSESDYSEMYISDEDDEGFECIDISMCIVLDEKKVDKEIKKYVDNIDNIEELTEKNEKPDTNKKSEKNRLKETNNETGILRQSFYNLGRYLLDYKL